MAAYDGGFTGLGGAAGAGEAIAKLIAQRLLEAKLLEEQRANQAQESHQSRSLDLQSRSLDQNDALRRDAQAETKKRDEATDADRVFKENQTLNESVPGGTEVSGLNPIVSRLMSIGALRPRGIDAPTPPMLAADPSESPELKGTIANAPSTDGDGRSFVKLSSAKQLDTEADNKRQSAAMQQAAADRQAALEDRQAGRDQAQEARQENIRLIASLKPPPADKLVKVEHKDPATGRTVIEWLPQSEVRGQKFDKGTSATTESRLASAQAVNQTGQDIIAKVSDPAYAKSLGVAMGRYSKLQDFIGNPPPEYAELAGMIESYALANMGVHGMRSAQGAQQIAKLLNQPHTPESIISTVKGLNAFSEHFMQNEGRATTQKPSQAEPKSGVKVLSITPVK